MPSTSTFPLQTQRLAVLATFAINGFLYASWASRVPMLQAQYGISDATFGLVLISASGGAFGSMPFAAYINNRYGLRPVVLATALLYCGVVASLPYFSQPVLLFGLFAIMGVGFGLLDVAMNAQAVEVERAYMRPIMSSFHAGFSGAMIAGALIGSAAIWVELPFPWHLGIAAILALVLLAYAYPRLMPDAPPEPTASSNAADDSAFRLPVRASWLLGFVGFCSMMSEASISDWTAKYMLDVAGSESYMAPWSLAAFSITMTIGRVFGDGFRQNYGDPLLLRGGALLALCGMILTLAYPTPLTTIAGATLVGAGLAVAVPIVFSLAGNIPGLSASAALAMVTTISYLGIFIGPAVIGFLAEAYGLRIGYGFIVVALACMVVLVWRVRDSGAPSVTPHD